MYAIQWWLDRLFGLKCQACDKRKRNVRRRHQNTAYANEASNWRTLCNECQAIEDDYWDERWDEYRSSRF